MEAYFVARTCLVEIVLVKMCPFASWWMGILKGAWWVSMWISELSSLSFREKNSFATNQHKAWIVLDFPSLFCLLCVTLPFSSLSFYQASRTVKDIKASDTAKPWNKSRLFGFICIMTLGKSQNLWSLRVLICKMGLLILTSQGHYNENLIPILGT